MKQCPECKTRYTDDSLQYCLQDGRPLEWIMTEPEEQTVVSERHRPIFPTPTHDPAHDRPPRRSRTGLIVFVSALSTLLVIGLIGAGAWILSRGGRAETARENVNVNSGIPRKSDPTPSATPTASPTPESSAPNSAAANRTPISAETSREVTREVAGWEEATESLDADNLTARYADKVDYYRTAGANRDFIRRDKERAFSSFDSVNFEISNMKITPGKTGDIAIAEFDKAWEFDGEQRSVGKVRSRLTFKKQDGRWLITSEQDIKIY